MIPMFLKKVVVVPAATIFLSMGASAMGQYDQIQCQQMTDQCSPEFNLELPKTRVPEITIQKKKHQITYELRGGTTVVKKQLVETELAAVQDFVDGDKDDKTFCQPKLPAISLGLEDGVVQKKGYNCEETETRVLKTKIDADFGGRKVGTIIVRDYMEAELVFGDASHATDALFVEGKTGCMSLEEFTDGMTEANYENFSLRDLRDQIDAEIRNMNKGCVASVKHVRELQQF